MCNPNVSIEDLEDLINNNALSEKNVNQELIYKFLLSLNDYVNEFIKINKTGTNMRLIINNLKKVFPKYLQKTGRNLRTQFKKSTLLFYYKKMLVNELIQENKFLELMLMKAPSRDISGINQITILTSPRPDGQTFSCKHDCHYCPNEPAHEGNNFTPQPRSYLYSEPAVLRANHNKFKPLDQTYDRLQQLLICGHK